MNYPKISIVTPNFNKAHYLEKTILSVLSQNYPNLEYIIIDGGSTDGSVEIINKYADQLAYWVSEPDEGVYHAIKKGFERTTGDIMAWIGSDDMYHPNSLFTVAQIFSDCPQISWLEGAQTHYDEQDRTVGVGCSTYYSHFSFLIHNFQWIQQESTFWRRGLYEMVGGVSVEYKLAGDFDLWMRFSRHEKLFLSDVLIGGFRHSETQLSKNREQYYREVDEIIAKEPISLEEQMQIKKLQRNGRVVSLLKRFKVLNWQKVNNKGMKWFREEERRQRIRFDFERNRFVVQK